MLELRARLEELRGSRSRVFDAGQKERKRLERNLHDGAQQRLIALSLELGLLEEQFDMDSDTGARLGQARREIANSLEELREVAHGIHPAVVSGHGLEIALQQLAARAPVPIRLHVDVGGRLPELLEVAVYYLVAESLANVGSTPRRHSSASRSTGEGARSLRRWPTMGSAGRIRKAARDCEASPIASKLWRAGFASGAQAAAAPGSGRRSRASRDRRGQCLAPRGHLAHLSWRRFRGGGPLRHGGGACKRLRATRRT